MNNEHMFLTSNEFEGKTIKHIQMIYENEMTIFFTDKSWFTIETELKDFGGYGPVVNMWALPPDD